MLHLRLVISVVALSFVLQGEVRQLSLLHTNDLHARLLPDDRKQGGFAYLATVLRNERAGCSSCLHLMGGDLVQGSPVSTIFKGTPVFEFGNKFNVDAFTLGNHEFDYTYTQIPYFLKKAKFPIVSANVVNADGQTMVKPYRILKVNGVRIAVIGAMLGDLTSAYVKPGATGPYKVTPVVETVARYAKELRPQVDLIVVLGHIHSQEEGSVILREVPEVNIVVEGHNHAGRKEMEVVDGRVAVNARAYGVEVGRLNVSVDLAAKRLTQWEWKRIPVDSTTVKPAPDVAKLVAKWESKVAKVVDRQIGESRRDLPQNELKPVLERGLAEIMGTDLAYLNRGGIRDRLPRGKILERNIWNIMPFDNEVFTARIKGSQVPDLIRGDRTLDPDKEYTLAIPDFAATNEASRKSLGFENVKFQSTGKDVRDVLIEWVRKKKVVE